MTVKTLGILGGGQLGRMSAQAAKKLGIATIIYTPEVDSPAAAVADRTIVADYGDTASLKKLAESCDAITYEFENIPAETVSYLKDLKPVLPDERLLAVAQDRIAEKTYLNAIGIATTNWHKITSPADIETARRLSKAPLILKTARFGYDGKGQLSLTDSMDAEESYAQLGGGILIAEERVDFESEISVIAARDHTGRIEFYGPVLNMHKNHILDRSVFPAPVESGIAQRAVSAARTLAEKIGLIGVLALEMFVTKDGRILANEIAPRTHNSGHWSIDACAVSQFENHVRAVCGLGVLPPAPHHGSEMVNLIGKDINDLSAYEGALHSFIHLYGKTEARPGRKMGHVTILKEPL